MIKTFKSRVMGGGNSLFHKVLIALIITILLFAVSCKESVYHEVRFNSNGGTVYMVQQVLDGERVLRVANPVRDGYTFEGWYSDPKYVHRYDFNQPVYQNLTLYAKWGSSVTYYTVTYVANGATSGTVPTDTAQYISGAEVTVSNNTGSLTNNSKLFEIWNTNAGGTGTTYNPGDKFNITENTILYAQYVSLDYLTFTAEAGEKVSVTPSSWWTAETKEYNIGNGWKTYESGPITSSIVLFRGLDGHTGSCENPNHYECWNITTTANSGGVNCSGNIETILDYSKVEYGDHPTMDEGCYTHMFSGQPITSAPELPAVTLANSCYEMMFYNCTLLATAPALSATSLAENCYKSMFANCNNLETAPALNATVLANSCCQEMFNGCSALKTAPVLSAKKYWDTSGSIPIEMDGLAPLCYERMFYGCSSLMISTLGDTGVEFFTCPDLSIQNPMSDTPVDYMFTGTGGFFAGTPTGASQTGTAYYYGTADKTEYLTFTANSEYVTVTPSTGWGDYSGSVRQYSVNNGGWYDWEEDVSIGNISSTKKIRLRGKDCTTGSNEDKWTINGNDIKVSGNIMTLLDYTNPNTVVISDGCFNMMFYGCSSLTDASELKLPATNLIDGCYKQMFWNCSALKKAPKISASTLPQDTPSPYGCCEGMFGGCLSLAVSTNSDCGGTEFFTFSSGESGHVFQMFWNTANYNDDEGAGTPTAGETYYWYINPPTL